MEKQTFSIPGISCDHCVRTIKNELSELVGVKSVEGNADRKTATIEWETPATLDLIKKTLEEIDYPAE